MFSVLVRELGWRPHQRQVLWPPTQVLLHDGLEEIHGVELQVNSLRVIGRSKAHGEHGRSAILGMLGDVIWSGFWKPPHGRELDVTLAALSVDNSAHRWPWLRQPAARRWMQANPDEERRWRLVAYTSDVGGEPVAHRNLQLRPGFVERHSSATSDDGVPRAVARLNKPGVRLLIRSNRVSSDRVWPSFVPENSECHRNSCSASPFRTWCSRMHS